MKVTRTGVCVICHGSVRETRIFLPQTTLFGPVPTGITRDMSKQVIAWRDTPVLCERDRADYTVKLR